MGAGGVASQPRSIEPKHTVTVAERHHRTPILEIASGMAILSFIVYSNPSEQAFELFATRNPIRGLPVREIDPGTPHL